MKIKMNFDLTKNIELAKKWRTIGLTLRNEVSWDKEDAFYSLPESEREQITLSLSELDSRIIQAVQMLDPESFPAGSTLEDSAGNVLAKVKGKLYGSSYGGYFTVAWRMATLAGKPEAEAA